MTSLPKFFWWRLRLLFFSELEESLIWKLKSLGINNYAIEAVPENYCTQTLFVWLPSYEWVKQDLDEFELSLVSLSKVFSKNLLDIKWEKIINEDWSLTWKKFWKPDPVGQKFLILPSWLDLPEKYSNRIILRLDPGSAFGTGGHPTTRLCLEALERKPPLGLKVADVGCGSGILSIASLALGAREVKAVDIDSLAIRATSENALLNNFNEAQLSASLGSIDFLEKQYGAKKFDLLLCNTLAPVIKEIAPGFSRITSSESDLFLSGLLIDQIVDITGCLALLDWEFVASYQLENWALIHLCKNSSEKESNDKPGLSLPLL